MNFKSSNILEKLKNKKKPFGTAERPPGVLDGLGDANIGTATSQAPATRQTPLYQEGTPPPTGTPVSQALGSTQVGPQGGGNILDFLGGDLKELYESNLEGMLSGDAFAPYKAASNEAFARAAQNIRARSAGGAGSVLGQGAATSAQQEAEQSILSGLATKGIEEGMAESELKKAGMGIAFKLAEAGEASNQFWGSLEQAKDLFEKGLLSQEKLKQMQINSTEKLAKDANWLIQQGIDQNNAKLFGYEDADGNWVKGTLEINEEKWGFEKKEWETEQAWASFHTAVLAGDYEGANEIAKANGLPTIDWTNVQEKEQLENITTGMKDIEIMLENLDPDSDEYKALIGKYGELFGEKQKLLGIPYTDEDIDNFITGLTDDTITDEEGAPFEKYLGSTVIDWWTNGPGKNLGFSLEGDAGNWYDTIADPNATDAQISDAAENLAFVINAIYTLDSGGTLTTKQKDAIKASGQAPDVWAETEEADFKAKVDSYWGGLESYGDLLGASGNTHELNDVYEALKKKAPGWTKAYHYQSSGNIYKFDNAPAEGSYIKMQGRLYVVTSPVGTKNIPDDKDDRQYFQVTEVDTGNTVEIMAGRQ